MYKGRGNHSPVNWNGVQKLKQQAICTQVFVNGGTTGMAGVSE